MASQQLNSLKTINTLQRDGSLQNILISIKQMKSDIDTFSKSVGEQKSKLTIRKQEEEKKKALELEKANLDKIDLAVKTDKETVNSMVKTGSLTAMANHLIEMVKIRDLSTLGKRTTRLFRHAQTISNLSAQHQRRVVQF